VQGVVRPDLNDKAFRMISSPTPIPEPASGCALGLLGSAALLRRKRRAEHATVL
jgi:hypothetical protein